MRFPPLSIGDDSLCNEFCREPRWKPLLTESEREQEATRQLGEAAEYSNRLPYLKYPIEPLNPVGNLADNIYLSGQSVLKVGGDVKREYKMYLELERKGLPVVPALGLLPVLDSDMKQSEYLAALATEMRGPSLDWVVFEAYPVASSAALNAARELGVCVAEFENAGVIQYDSHLSNFAHTGKTVLRLDVEPVRWSDMHESLVPYEEREWLREPKLNWRGRTRRCEEILYIAESFQDIIFKSDILKFPQFYRWLARDYLFGWGPEGVDSEHNKQFESKARQLFKYYVDELICGYKQTIVKRRAVDLIHRGNNLSKQEIASLLERHGIDTKDGCKMVD